MDHDDINSINSSNDNGEHQNHVTNTNDTVGNANIGQKRAIADVNDDVTANATTASRRKIGGDIIDVGHNAKTTAKIFDNDKGVVYDAKDNDDTKPAATLAPNTSTSTEDYSSTTAYDIGSVSRPTSNLYFNAIIDGNTGQTSRIKVENGDDIDTIKNRIRSKNPSFDVSQMFLYECEKSDEDDEPLDPFDIVWSANVNWGTRERPLIVKVRHVATQPPLHNSNNTTGMYIV